MVGPSTLSQMMIQSVRAAQMTGRTPFEFRLSVADWDTYTGAGGTGQCGLPIVKHQGDSVVACGKPTRPELLKLVAPSGINLDKLRERRQAAS